MKISIIGSGNVGATSALRVAQDCLGEVVLVDVVKGLAKGKAYDLEDARALLKINYNIEGTDDFTQIKGSDIIVVTAGLARKPGMTREELLLKNAAILKEICLNIKTLAPQSVLIIVTNPLDVMTNYALKVTGFKGNKVFGMGVSLDAARFANIISKELNVNVCDIDAVVIGSHGEGMLPLPGLSGVKGVPLEKLADSNKIKEMVTKTINRGAEIVALLGSGSAYYAPSAAISTLVKAVAKNEKRKIGVCACLNGEYGLKDVCLGVSCIIGREGILSITEPELKKEESELLKKSAENIRQLVGQLSL
ncbi:MAG: malate dehydrogenase [Candidatus Omnitrophota bacterium]|jgi:malate dehydrogenase